MSFVAGLVWGLVIAGLEVASEHFGPSFGAIALNGNGALGVPQVLVPVALFWGWLWITNRWSGRAFIFAIAFVIGLYIGVGAVAPADALLFPQGPQSTLANAVPGLIAGGAIFVLIPALIGGALFALLRAEWFRTNAVVLAVLYLVGLATAVAPFFGPIVAGGIIGGTAAGHAWRSPGARTPVLILLVVLMLFAVFGVPFVLGGGGRLTPPRFPALTR